MKRASVSRLEAVLLYVDNDIAAFRSLWGKQKSYKSLIKTKDTAVFHPNPFADRLYSCKYFFVLALEWQL